jgi:predicted dehydrogenase
MDKLQAGGGWTYDGGVHLMDSLVVYFGPIETVFAEQKAFVPTVTVLKDGRRVDSGREDSCIATFRFASGVIGTWVWSFCLPGVDFMRVAFYGEKGYVLDQTAGGWTHTFGGGFIPSQATVHLPDGSVMPGRDLELEYLLQLDPDQRERLFPHGVQRSVAQECHEFVDCIRLGRAPEVGPHEGLEGLAISAAVYESALSGQAVRVADVRESRIDAFQRPVDQHWGLV